MNKWKRKGREGDEIKDELQRGAEKRVTWIKIRVEKEENGKEEKGKDGKGGRADGMRVKTKATDGQMDGLIGKKGMEI